MAVPTLDQWRRANDGRPLHRALGLRAEEIGEGYAQMRVTRTAASAGGPDGTAGGDAARVSTFAVTTAADVALLGAVSTTVQGTPDTMNGTAELSLTYVRQPAGEAVVRATVLHRGRHAAVVDMRVTDEGGETVAFGRGTYSIRPGTAQPR